MDGESCSAADRRIQFFHEQVNSQMRFRFKRGGGTEEADPDQKNGCQFFGPLDLCAPDVTGSHAEKNVDREQSDCGGEADIESLRRIFAVRSSII